MARTSKKVANINEVKEVKTAQVEEVNTEVNAEVVSPLEGVFLESANTEKMKVGEIVTVCKIHNNTNSKVGNPFTVTFKCQKTGPKGGTYFTFHQSSTNKEYKLGTRGIIISVGHQYHDEPRLNSKKVNGENVLVIEDCNIPATDEHPAYTKKCRFVCNKWAKDVVIAKF